jgi:hypothetical protein
MRNHLLLYLAFILLVLAAGALLLAPALMSLRQSLHQFTLI